MEATAPDLTSDIPDEKEMPEDMLQEEDGENEEEEIYHDMQAEDEEDEEDEEAEMLQQLLTQCHNCECTEGHSAVFLIATMLADDSPP
jgi:hypothetical protein